MERKYVVTKSNKLITANYDLSLQEQKIILALASMVQPQDIDFKPYIFKIRDFIELLGVSDEKKYIEIPKLTKELMHKVFEIKEGNKILQLAWLSSAEYEKGTGMVELEFSPKLKPYMLGLKEFYTSYRLENILMLKSKYSIRLYEILKSNLYKTQVIIELEELKNLVGAKERTYNTYANFKNKIILRLQKELKAKTDISFEFEEIKTGRKVTSITFKIKANGKKSKAKDEIAVASSEPQEQKEKISKKDIEQVKSIMYKHSITTTEAKAILKDAKGNIDMITKCYEYAMDKDINNMVAYIRTIVKEFNEPKGNTKTSTFNNFKQRNYDFEDLKKKLLGWE